MSEKNAEKNVIEISTYGAGRRSLDDSLKYQRTQAKTVTRIKVICATVSTLIVAISPFKKGPDLVAPPSQSELPTPSIDGNQPNIDLSLYNRGDEARRAESASHKKAGSKTTVHLTGPKLIPRSVKIRVPPGTSVKAILVTGASNGLTKALLKEDVTVAGESYLNSGTTLIGTGVSTDDRLFVHFTRAVLEDGSVLNIEAEIADQSDQTVGLKGSFWANHAGRIAAGAGLNFIAGASVALEDTQGQQGAVVTSPTVRNAILGGTAKATLEESNEIASKYKNSPPAIQIKPGTEVVIIFIENGG
jgi:type IV secretory pathway VirB10-like protein